MDSEVTFDELANQWERETAHLSSMTEMVAHPAYQAIIAMGLNALPFIFLELRCEPNWWFAALHEITGEDPTTPEDAGHLSALTASWLVWAHKHGF